MPSGASARSKGDDVWNKSRLTLDEKIGDLFEISGTVEAGADVPGAGIGVEVNGLVAGGFLSGTGDLFYLGAK